MKWLDRQCEKSAAIWSLNGAIAELSFGAFLLGTNLAVALKSLKAGDSLGFVIEIAQAPVFLLWLLFGIAMTHTIVRRLVAQGKLKS